MTADAPIRLHAQGRISAEVALARLVLAGLTAVEIGALLGAHGVPAGLVRLFDARRRDLDRLAVMLAQSGLDHAAGGEESETVRRIRDGFDRAVACAPEASVAAYSLGDQTTLDGATAELIAWLDREALLPSRGSVLDLGCGIGRVAAALAPRVRVLGLDVSPGMIAEAERRYGDRAGLRFGVTEGRDLDALPERGFDLVLAVDTFPYLMQAGPGLAERHVAGAARILRPGGALAILNLSYRGDDAADRAVATAWAASYGFLLTRAGIRPFRLWDGTAFLLRRAELRA